MIVHLHQEYSCIGLDKRDEIVAYSLFTFFAFRANAAGVVPL
jgi:hypothetical protein